MLCDMMKLNNMCSRFREKTFYICMCKVQIQVVKLPFFSSDTPILKKWILLPHNAWSPTYKSLYLEHNVDHPLQFSVKVCNAYNFTYTHTHTHNMPSWHDTGANKSLSWLKIVTKLRPWTCHFWGTFLIQNDFSMFSSTDNGALKDNLQTYPIHEAKFFIGQFLFLGDHIFSQLQEWVFISPEQLFHCHLHKRFDLKNVHNGCHC